jgi:radical SAM superfamily enzyme YgiQ (UPF0313 family)
LRLKFIQTTRYLNNGKLLKAKSLFYPSLTFPLLAALTPSHYGISIHHEIFETIDFDEKVDLVGISSITTNIYRAYEVADEFRKRGVHVAMGGIHVSMVPEEAMAHADTIFIGEAEETWPKFLEDFEAGKPEKIYRPEKPPSLAGLPVPRWSLIDKSRYLSFAAFHKFKLKGAYPVQTSRGCDFSCEFCSTRRFSGGAGYRARPIEDVVHEIKCIGAKRLFFVDDNIFAKPARAKKLFRALIPLDVKWGGQGVILAGSDPELIDLARKSGCYFVVAGLESITPEVLDSIVKKNDKVGEYEKNIQAFRKAKIDLDVSMMFGFDDDKPSVFKDTYAFLMKCRVPYISWLPLTPFPGTGLYQRLKRQDRLKHEKWWLKINPDMKDKIYGLLYTGIKIDEEYFCENFFMYYRKFYSLPSILKRLAFPPGIRAMVTILINLSLRKKISTEATVAEH